VRLWRGAIPTLPATKSLPYQVLTLNKAASYTPELKKKNGKERKKEKGKRKKRTINIYY
jgi:hypothetical protein